MLLDAGGELSRSWASLTPSIASTPTTTGAPAVSVPVLSMSRTSTRASASSARPDLISSPRRAAVPIDANVAIGTVTMSEQEQAMISTLAADSAPRPKSQAPHASTRMTGAYHRASRSIVPASRGRSDSACSTALTTRPNALFAPMDSARTRIRPP